MDTPERASSFHAMGVDGLLTQKKRGWPLRAARRSRRRARLSWMILGGDGAPDQRWRRTRAGMSSAGGAPAERSRSTLIAMASRGAAEARLGGRWMRSIVAVRKISEKMRGARQR